MEVGLRIETNKVLGLGLPLGKGNTVGPTGDNSGGHTLDEMNNFQCIASNCSNGGVTTDQQCSSRNARKTKHL